MSSSLATSSASTDLNIASRIARAVRARRKRRVEQEEEQRAKSLVLMTQIAELYFTEAREQLLLSPRSAQIQALERQNKMLRYQLTRHKARKRTESKSKRRISLVSAARAALFARRVAGSRWKTGTLNSAWATSLSPSIDTVIAMVIAAQSEGAEELLSVCINFIKENIHQLKSRDDFQKLRKHPDILLRVLN